MLSRPASRAIRSSGAYTCHACLGLLRPWHTLIRGAECGTSTRPSTPRWLGLDGGQAKRGEGKGNGKRAASSSSSSTRWKSRQGKDSFAREARVQGLKSRAAFKLLEIDAKYRIFKKGQTVVDLGYAPGSWSQVAVERTKPNSRVVGIDIIPAQPPVGVSTIQGNFLSPGVRAQVKRYLSDPDRGRRKASLFELESSSSPDSENITTIGDRKQSYIDAERHMDDEHAEGKGNLVMRRDGRGQRGKDEDAGLCVDVVLSDMSAPWEQTTGFWKKSLSNPYRRMMNTTGIAFKDHAGSMDLCSAALEFARDTLRTGGSFICKFYQGSEDKEFERQLKLVFKSVHREKPESSRSESKEAYFVALRKKPVTPKVLGKGAEGEVEAEAFESDNDLELEDEVLSEHPPDIEPLTEIK